ncbi:ribonuclease H2 non-catalytic subunit-domain-containing protein [Chaetomidium leptoderma]|uniref:Ribonuclease H2 non-catalytic subunit-domain-containing protein n=1 Tax=Chaetomidium leptoderma TaxID=669021 RepID=A0AAN6VY46_9PEZI|nr:ribonuclease H2 non-catalytic subunit-domain-containing protein [Chaetomidium leptoderma]
MSQPMLSLKSEASSGETPKATPHLLPCRVHHTGSVEPVQSFWEPKVNEDGTPTAYFRGRKLLGKTAKLPEGYRGVVAVTCAAEEPSGLPEEGGVIDLEAETPQGSLQVQAEFDEMVVWAHEAAVDASADPYLRGAEEWLALAEKIHSYPSPAPEEK